MTFILPQHGRGATRAAAAAADVADNRTNVLWKQHDERMIQI